VVESVHFVGPEKGGKVYRFIVTRRKNNQLALFPEYQYTYRFLFPKQIGISIKSFTFTDSVEMLRT